MNAVAIRLFPPRQSRAAASGIHTLAPGQALAWAPGAHGELRVQAGAVWLTFDVPAHGPPRGPLGDLVLGAGARLPLQPGQRVVLEPIAQGRGTHRLATATLAWHPACAPQTPDAPPAESTPAFVGHEATV
ncbi:MAG: DUF2917 domain-containing protein [Pseudomonadota bacterium]|nr:DUF2917 domain-containing protein [Pseudomonadota bacterium]